MAIAPGLTFYYEFAVRSLSSESAFEPDPAFPSTPPSFLGPGRSDLLDGLGDLSSELRDATMEWARLSKGGMVGPNPRFELREGWLILRPSEGWARSFFQHEFSDFTMGHEEWKALVDRARAGCDGPDYQSVPLREGQYDPDALEQAEKEADQRKAIRYRQMGLTRDLASYSLYVGEALSKVLQDGDLLRFSRGPGADFRYSVRRNGETIFSAGSIPEESAGYSDEGGPFAVWQSSDAYPKSGPALPAAASGVYATARVGRQMFRLIDNESVESEGYCVYLARRNPVVTGFEYSPRAVHAAGGLDTPGRQLIVDAARQLLSPKTVLL